MRRTCTYAVAGLIALFVAENAGAQRPGTQTMLSAATAPTLKGEPGDKGPRADKGPTGEEGPTRDQGPAGGPAIRVAHASYPVPATTYRVYYADCKANERVVGGGYEFNITRDPPQVILNAPLESGGSWRVILNNTSTVPVTVKVYAVCISGL